MGLPSEFSDRYLAEDHLNAPNNPCAHQVRLLFQNLYDVVFDIFWQPVWEDIVKQRGDTPHSHVNG